MAEKLSDFLGLAGNVIHNGVLYAYQYGLIDTTKTINGSDMKPGIMVTTTGETTPDVDVAADGEAVYGILLEDPSEKYSADVDTVYTDDSPARILKFPAGPVQVWALQDQAAGAAVEPGDHATVSGATAGHITNVVADREIDYCGRYLSEDAAGSTDVRVELLVFS
jgi:hypothetical protein